MATEEFRVRFTQDGAKEIVRTFDDMLRGAETAEEAAAKLVKATNEVRRAADPAQRAYDNLAKSVNVLSKAEQAGIISAGERLGIQNRLTISAQANLQPIGTLISKIGEESRAWGLSNTQRQAALRTMQQVNALQRQGVLVSAQEKAAITAANLAYVQKKEAVAAAAQAERTAASQVAAAARQQEQAAKSLAAQQVAAAKKAAQEQAASAAQVVAENKRVAQSYDAVYRQSGTIVESALSRRRAALEAVENAQKRGIITADQAADAERRLARQYAEQIDPLQRVERLQRERVNYLSGLFQQGRQLGLVNANLARLDAQGIVLDQRRVQSLRALAKQADQLQHTYEGLNRAKTLFSNVIGGIGLGIAAAGLTKSLDDVTTLNNRLALVSTSAANTNRLFAENVQLAIATRSDLTATVEGFSRIARSTKQIGLSQREALTLTSEVNKSLKISGATAQEAAATVVQFGQALSSNRLGGDELRSVLEQAPRLSQAIVDGINLMNRTDPTQLPKKLAAAIKKSGDINIGTLRALAKQGLLTTEVVSRAVLSQQAAIDSEFARTIPTIADSFTNLKTSWLSFLNTFNKGSGAARAISGAIQFVAKNLETIASIAIVVGSALAGAFVGRQISAFVNFLSGLPTAFSAASQSINANTVSLDNENIALARNTALQVENATARQGVSVAAGAQAGRIAAGSATGAVGAAASGAANAGVFSSSGAAAAAAVRANMQATATAATTAATRTGILATGLGIARTAAGGLVSILGGLSVALGIVAALAAVWLLVKDRISLANDELLSYGEGTTQKAIRGNITLGDTVSGIFDTLIGKTDSLTASQIAGSKKATTAGISDAHELSAEQIVAQQAALDGAAVAATQTFSVYDNMHASVAKSAADLVGNLVTGATYISSAFVNTFKLIAAVANNVFNTVANSIAALFNSTLLPLLNKAAEFGIGTGASPLKADRALVNVGDLGAQLDQEAKANAVRVGNITREATARAIVSTAADRNRGGALGGLNPGGDNTVTNPPGKPTKPKKDTELEKLKSAYRQLRDELNPLLKITEDYEKDQKTLNDAEARGLINASQKADLMARLTRRFQEASDPLGKYIKDTKDELAILSLSADKREAATAILAKEREERDRLRRELLPEEKARIAEIETLKVTTQRQTELNDSIVEAGRQRNIELGQIGLTAQQLEAEQRARATLGDAIKNNVAGAAEQLAAQTKIELAFIQTRDAAKRVQDIYESLTQSQRTFAQDSNALNTLLNSGRISLERYNKELRNLTSAVLQDSTSGLAGFERALINIKNKTEDTASSVQQIFENAFSGLEDAFVGIFTDGRLDIQSVLKGITGDLARTLFRKVTDGAVTALGSAFNIPGFGKSGLTDQQIQANNVYINGNVVGGSALGGFGLPTSGPTGATAGGAGGAGVDQAAFGIFGDPASLVAANQTAAGQINGIWGATSSAMSGNWQGAITQMVQQSGLFQTTQATTGAAVNAITATTAATDVGVHTAAEAAKTGATATGAATRTGIEVAASTTSKGLTISSAILSIGANAVKAATGAYAAIAGIPVVGPFLAPVVAAGALAAVFGLGKKLFSAEGGLGSVPYDGALTELHKEEMVLPAKYANPLRDQLTGPDSGKGKDKAAPDVNLDQKIVNVLDPAAMLDALQTTAGQRVLMNFIQSNPEAIKRALSV